LAAGLVSLKRLTKDKARRIAGNVAKLLEFLKQPRTSGPAGH
jgi:hypothetical protein